MTVDVLAAALMRPGGYVGGSGSGEGAPRRDIADLAPAASIRTLLRHLRRWALRAASAAQPAPAGVGTARAPLRSSR